MNHILLAILRHLIIFIGTIILLRAGNQDGIASETMKTLSLRTLFLQLVIIILIFQPIALGYTKRNLKNVSVRGRKNLIIDESIDCEYYMHIPFKFE